MPRKLRPIHAGEILREEFLKPLGLSANRLAIELHIPQTRVAEIVNAKRAITPDTALRLAQFFRNTPDFWLNLQTRYDLLVAEDKELARVKREVRPMAAGALRSAGR